MTPSPSETYHLIKRAHVVAASKSAHPHNKIGSVLKLATGQAVESSNLWLHYFAPDYDVHVKLGSASPSKHSEPAAVNKASQSGLSSLDATLYITDPPCPNCMNAMAASGVRAIVIDAHAFDGGSEWYKRRARHFDQTSLQIAANARMEIWVSDLDEVEKVAALEPVKLPAPTKSIDYNAAYHIEKRTLSDAEFQELLRTPDTHFNDKAWARLLIPTEDNVNEYDILTTQTLTTLIDGDRRRLMKSSKGWGDLSPDQQEKALEKYKRQIYPLDYARNICGRLGITLKRGTQMISSRVPASREQVNLCDVLPYIQLHVLDESACWMPTDQQALAMFKRSGVGLRLSPEMRRTNNILG